MFFKDQNDKANQNQELNQDDIQVNNQENECMQELARTKEKLQYLAAEFENYKKRYERERASWVDQSQMDVFKDIIPVVDDLERAIDNQNNIPSELKAHLEGFEIIFKEMKKVLDSYNVKEIIASGELNPEEHEAMVQVQSDDVKSGEIVQVLQKGYKFKNKVIRAAKVSVAA